MLDDIIDTFYYLKESDGTTDKPDTEGVKMVMTDGSVCNVPYDDGNRHWRLYQEWLAVPNTTQSE